MNQINISYFKSINFDSIGQVGHLNFCLFYVILSADILDITWPHYRSIGGLSGLVTSLETGQTKKEWYLNSFPKSTSIGISFDITSEERSYKYLIYTSSNLIIFYQFRHC